MPTRVAITGLNAGDNPGPGVACARALRASGRDLHLVGLAYDAMEPGIYIPGLFDEVHLLPYPSAGASALLHRLKSILHQCPVDVLLPTLDAELPVMLDSIEALHGMGLRTLLPTREQYDRRAKPVLHELAAADIPVPRQETLFDLSPLYTAHDRLGFPLMVKGPYYGAEVAYSIDDATAAFHRLAATWGLPVVLQEHIPGEDVNVCALGDGQGGLVGAVAMKKLVTNDAGKGWAGVTIAEPRLMALSRRIIEALSWRGGCEIELRRDPDGAYHLLEINPRFPAWCDLTAAAGQNLLIASIDLALGRQIPRFTSYETGIAFVRASMNHIVSVADMDAVFTGGPRPAERR